MIVWSQAPFPFFEWNKKSNNETETSLKLQHLQLQIGHVWYINILMAPRLSGQNFYDWWCFLCIQFSYGIWKKEEKIEILMSLGIGKNKNPP